MRRGWVVVVLLAALLVAPGSALAQGAKGVDGTVWTKLNADNKALFTLGYFTGIQIFAKFVPGPCTTCQSECLDDATSKLVPVGTSIPNVVGMVDSIYADPGNLVIPVQWALKLAAQKAKGMSDEDFKAAVADARASSAPAEAPAQDKPQAPPAQPPKPPTP
jgi:hypothetical protein